MNLYEELPRRIWYPTVILSLITLTAVPGFLSGVPWIEIAWLLTASLLGVIALLLLWGLLGETLFSVWLSLPGVRYYWTSLRDPSMSARWILAILAMPLALAFTIHLAVNRVAHRPDPHGTAVVAMVASSTGDLLASVDVKGGLRLMDLANGVVEGPAPATATRHLRALFPIPNQTAVIAAIDMSGRVSLHSRGTGWMAEPAQPGTYLAAAVNAEGLIAVALAREPARQQQQQQQQGQQQVQQQQQQEPRQQQFEQQQQQLKQDKDEQPKQQQQQQASQSNSSYVVEFQNPQIGELTLPRRPTVLAPYIAGPTRAIFPSDSKFQPFLIGFADGSVGIITIESGGPRLGLSSQRPSVQAHPIHLVTSGEDGDIASVDTGGRVKYWQIDPQSGILAVKRTSPSGMEVRWSSSSLIRTAAFSPDGADIATGLQNGKVEILDVATGLPIRNLEMGSEDVLAVAYSPDGTLLITGGRDGARLWDVATGNVLWALSSQVGIVRAVAFSPDGMRVATASEDETTARIWDARTGSLLKTLEGHKGFVLNLVFSSDGTRVVTASTDTTTRIWSADSGSTLMTLEGHSWSVNDVAYSPNGAYLVTASTDGTARIWDPATGAQIKAFEGHAGAVATADFSPNGKLIATAFVDGTVRIWDATAGTLLTKLNGTSRRNSYAQFSPDGTRIAILSGDDTISISPLSLCIDCVGAWFVGNSKLNLATREGSAIEVDTESGLIANTYKMSPSVASAVADVPGHALAGNRTDGETEWLDMDGDGLMPLGIHADSVSAAVKLPDGRVALGFLDGTVEIVDPRMHGLIATADIWPETRELAISAISQLERLWARASSQVQGHWASAIGQVEGLWAPPGAGVPAPPGARLFVLTIGISDYGANATQLKLDYADDDARDVAKALMASQSGLYAQVLPQVLTDSEATWDSIFRALNAIRRQMEFGDGNDLVVIMFAGHGALLGDEGSKEFYLLPYDVDTRSGVPLNALAMSDFRSQIERMARKGRVLVLLDAAHSGAMSDGTPFTVDGDALSTSLSVANVSILTSSRRNETSREDGVWRNGAFTEALLEAFNGAADKDRNKRLSIPELVDYLSERLPALTNGRQNPGVALRFVSDVFAVGDR